MSQRIVRDGIAELNDPERMAALEPTRSRRPGGGRPSIEESQPGIVEALDALVEPTTRGDPMSPLRWTCKSARELARALGDQGFSVAPTTVCELLRAQGYSLQALRKTREGLQHPDRDAQFRHIQKRVEAMQADEQPVISVDCKKKELVGDFKNGGREWQPKGEPDVVRVHDFADKALGKVIPYGIYDVARNEGWVSVGVDHETSEFAVNSIAAWWRNMGRRRYPDATDLLVVADGGGANNPRRHAWKLELQQFANRTGLHLHVAHMPPGTSKWNKIEHRLFSHITQNWRGRPLLSREVVVNLIAATTTAAGLRVKARIDTRSYPTGRKVPKEALDALSMEPDEWHGDWNYVIHPRSQSR